MSAILCEGIDEDMAMLKILKRYFRLKAEITEIEQQLREFGFKSAEECVIFLTLAEATKPYTRKEIEEKSTVGNASASILTRLCNQHLVRSTEDSTDSKNRILRRLLFTITPNGLELYQQLKQQLQ